jgi:hypothetical protein
MLNLINSIHKCALPEKCQINVKDQVVPMLDEALYGAIFACTAGKASRLHRLTDGAHGIEGWVGPRGVDATEKKNIHARAENRITVFQPAAQSLYRLNYSSSLRNIMRNIKETYTGCKTIKHG